MGDYGFVQDHAIHVEVLFWREDKPVKIDSRVVQTAILQADQERRQLQQNAAMRASMIMKRCLFGRHEYLRRKGFPDEKGAIWCHDKTEHLVVPMYDELNRLVGLQTIDAEGNKKFLYGQQTRGANFVIGRQGQNILCEGYATGLSIRAAMQSLKNVWKIHVCFSANNLVTISKRLKPGLVVADNDVSGTGEKIAKASGWPYWISDKTGEDFNDTHARMGLFGAAKSLWQSLYPSCPEKWRDKQTFAAAIDSRELRHEIDA
jgi:putative DNA primase/helicase